MNQVLATQPYLIDNLLIKGCYYLSLRDYGFIIPYLKKLGKNSRKF